MPSNLDETSSAQVAAELLKVYDYARAKDLLDRLGLNEGAGGPYLVSTEIRPSGATGSSVLVDMSRASPPLVFEWVRTFYWLVAEQPSWDQVALKKLALNFRNVLSITARRVPEMFGQIPGVVRLSSHQ